MGWVVEYLKAMWNQGAEKGKQMKKRDTERVQNLVERKKKK